MDEQITTLRFKVPGRDSPGYLARIEKGLEFRREMNGEEPTPEMIRSMVEFLAQYIIEPADMEQRIEALYQASQNEFDMLLEALTGEDNRNPTKSARKRPTERGTSSRASQPRRRCG